MITINLSAVVHLIDGFRGKPLVGGAPRFTIAGRPWVPQIKPQAFYAFCGLEAGAHTIDIAVDGFMPAQVLVTVPMTGSVADGVRVCRLEPDSLYPYPTGTTVLRGRVAAAPGKTPLAGVAVGVRYRTARGKELEIATRTSGRADQIGYWAVALKGGLVAAPVATVRCEGLGHPACEKQVDVLPYRSKFLDISLS